MAETIKTQIRKVKVRNDASTLPPELLKTADFKKGGTESILIDAITLFPGNRFSPDGPSFELEEAKKKAKQTMQDFVSRVNMQMAREVAAKKNFLDQKTPFIKLTKLEFKKINAEHYEGHFSFSTDTGIPCTKKTNQMNVRITKNDLWRDGKWRISGFFLIYVQIEVLTISNTKKNQTKYPELIGRNFYVWKRVWF